MNKGGRTIQNFNQTLNEGGGTLRIPRDEALKAIDYIRERNNKEILAILAEE